MKSVHKPHRLVDAVDRDCSATWAGLDLPTPLLAEEHLRICLVDAHDFVISAACVVEYSARVAKDLTVSVSGDNVAGCEAARGIADDPIPAVSDVGCL
jgi:hypothetical protein